VVLEHAGKKEVSKRHRKSGKMKPIVTRQGFGDAELILVVIYSLHCSSAVSSLSAKGLISLVRESVDKIIYSLHNILL
jgi:hypothetical protein